MTNNELKTTLLNELESETTDQLIREGLQDLLKYESNQYITVDKEYNFDFNMKHDIPLLCLEIDWEGNDLEYELYNFGNNSHDNLEKYMILHKELLKNGLTEEQNFENWFNDEYIYNCDEEIRTIKEILNNKINELF